MNTMEDINKTNAHLHTFIDGRLDKTSRLKAHAFLKQHSEKNVEFKSYQATDKQIRASLDDVYKNIPEILLDIIDRFEPQAEKKKWWQKISLHISWSLISIHVSIAVLAVFMGYLIAEYTLQTKPPANVSMYVKVARLAVEAHVIYSAEKEHAVELGATKKIELMSWFTKRFGIPVGPADLTTHGYTFLGGRLLPSAGEYAALFMYVDEDNNRLTLYIRKHASITKNITSDVKCNNGERDMFACSWYGRDLAYFLIGQPLSETNRKVVQAAAVAVGSRKTSDNTSFGMFLSATGDD